MSQFVRAGALAVAAAARRGEDAANVLPALHRVHDEHVHDECAGHTEET